MANGKEAIGSFQIAHPRFIFSTHANAECGTVGDLVSVSGLFAPRGQNKSAQGKVRWRQPTSDALGFDHPARRASQTVAIVTARRRARINPYIATSVQLRPRSPGGLMAHGLLGRRSHCTLGTRAALRSAPGCFVVAPSERRSNAAMVLLSVSTKQCSSSKGNAGTASLPRPACPFRFIPAIGPTDRTPWPTAKKL